MCRLGFILIMVIVMYCCNLVTIRNNHAQRIGGRNREIHLEEARGRPELGLDYAKVANCKLSSFKTSYRIGEMMTLDIALLNVADRPIRFRNLSNVEMYLNSDVGTSAPASPYLIVESPITHKSYKIVEPEKIMTRSIQLLLGCNQRAFDQMNELFSDNMKNAFEQGRFVNWGQGCFKITQPGKYIVDVGQKNYFVVVSNDKEKLKTAIGAMRCSPLPIMILE